MSLTEKRRGFRKIKKFIPCKLLTNIITNLEVPVKHIRANKYSVFRKGGNFFIKSILSQGHCTIQITNKLLQHDLSHAYSLSKLVSDYLGSLE